MSYPTVNRVLVIGRLTRDPALQETASGEIVCNLRVACDSTRCHPDGGFEQNYFDVEVLGTHGANVAERMRRGERMAIDGRLRWRAWKDSFKEARESVTVVADMVQCLDGAGGRGDGQRHLELVGAGMGEDAC
jgi:single-strand DNA-binding protein